MRSSAAAAAAGVLGIACRCIGAPASTAWPGTAVHLTANTGADDPGKVYAMSQDVTADMGGSGL